MAQVQNFTWDQGADLDIKLIYKEGATAETAAAVDLSANYSVRMDIVVPATKERVYTFNSATIADVDPITAGNQADSVIENVLSSGAGGTPNITIRVPRAATLPGSPNGAIYTKMTDNQTPITTFNYDIFLRNTTTDKQAKVLTGTITIAASYTLWP